MPLYEYECDTCGHRVEVIQKFSDEPLAACPKCQGPVRKLLSSPAIQFKGSGWYITDYAKKSGASAGAAKSETATTSEKSSESSAGDSAKKSEAPAKPATPSS